MQNLYKPNYKERTMEIDDFSSVTEFANNIVVGKELYPLKMGTMHFKKYYYIKANKAYLMGDRNFIHCNDGYLYEDYPNDKGRDFDYKTHSYYSPCLKYAMYKGNKHVFFVSEQKFEILDTTDDYEKMTKGNHMEIYSNRLFVCKTKEVHYSNGFDYSTYTTNTEDAGYISVADEDGKILNIINYDKCLLIFCEHSIYELTLNDNTDITLKKCEFPYLKIIDNSIVRLQNQVFFINNNKIWAYKDGKIYQKHTIYDKYLVNLKNFSEYYGKYLVEIRYNAKNYLLIFDSSDESATIFGGFDGELSHKCIIDNNTRELLTFDETTYTSGQWLSKKIDFDNPNKKTLSEVSIYMNKKGTMTISGDFGTKTLKLESGYNVKRLNLFSKDFSFSIDNDGAGFFAKNLKLKYRLTEE